MANAMEAGPMGNLGALQCLMVEVVVAVVGAVMQIYSSPRTTVWNKLSSYVLVRVRLV